jgi:enoyl-CoA hydratase
MSNHLTIADLIAGSDLPLVVADRGPVRMIVLNRPAVRNALTRQMRRDFAGIVADADADSRVAVIVMTGADPAFSAGVDLRERGDGPPPPPVRPYPGTVLRAARTPVIAAVNGACVGGALEMALSCSFIIASERARFADTHAKLGLFPSWGQTALLPRAIGIRRARQLILTGAFINAATALDWGLANEVVAHAALLDRCVEIGSLIAAAEQFCAALHLAALSESENAGLLPALDVEERTLLRWEAWIAERAAASPNPSKMV